LHRPGIPRDHAHVGHHAARGVERGDPRRHAVDARAGRRDISRGSRREPRRAGPGAPASTIGKMKPFAGVYTPIVTPFRDDDTVDEAGLRSNVRRWMSSALTGIVVLGSNGEAPQLDDDEADRVVAVAREEVPAGRPYIVGTGREST